MGSDLALSKSRGHKLTGFLRTLDDEFDSDCDFRIRECVLTGEKFTMDWDEDGNRMHARLLSEDGLIYRGTFGDPTLNNDCKMDAVRHDFNDDVFLLASWSRKDTGYGGIFNVFLKKESILSATAYAMSKKIEGRPEKASSEAHTAAAKAHQAAAMENGENAIHHKKMAKGHEQWAEQNAREE